MKTLLSFNVNKEPNSYINIKLYCSFIVETKITYIESMYHIYSWFDSLTNTALHCSKFMKHLKP